MYEYPKDEILVKSVRDGLVDEVHSGFIVFANSKGYRNIKGQADDYPFYMRSCAKPLQAALLIDYGADEFYQMSEEEIALCSASHAGEEVHTRVLKGLLDKIGLDESVLKCGLHEPLSKTRQKELLLENVINCPLSSTLSKREREKSYKLSALNFPLSTLYNNCSGKHTMMLALCKMKGWDIENYYMPNHPLQIEIKKKIRELCEVEKDYPETTDGCGVPIVSMPLHNMLKGYLNLFCSDKYKKIRDAFLHFPYLIGGEDRTDTKIIIESGKLKIVNSEQTMSELCHYEEAKRFADEVIQPIKSMFSKGWIATPYRARNDNNLSGEGAIIAKVGAGGLCIVVNCAKSEAFAVKITDCDMKAREFVVIDMINKLGWANIRFDNSIKTLHGEKVGYLYIE